MKRRSLTKTGTEAPSARLAALRSVASSRLFPGSVTGPTDTSREIVPRIMGAEIEYRSRILEEIAMMQHLLLTESLRPLKERAPASLPALIREMRGCIRDSLKIVKDAPLGTGAESYKTQAADLLSRRAVVLAEIRRRGLEGLLQAPGAKSTRQPERNPGLEEIAALVAGGEPAAPAEREPEPPPAPAASEGGVSGP